MKRSVLWDITQCSPLKFNRRFGGTRRLHHHGRRTGQARNQHEELCIMLVSCLANSLALMMEATCTTETSVDFKRTTRLYIPEEELYKRKYSVSS
jgi:hypothetical protein